MLLLKIKIFNKELLLGITGFLALYALRIREGSREEVIVL